MFPFLGVLNLPREVRLKAKSGGTSNVTRKTRPPVERCNIEETTSVTIGVRISSVIFSCCFYSNIKEFTVLIPQDHCFKLSYTNEANLKKIPIPCYTERFFFVYAQDSPYSREKPFDLLPFSYLKDGDTSGRKNLLIIIKLIWVNPLTLFLVLRD